MKRSAAVLFFGFLALYLLTMGGHLYSPDEEILFRTTRSLAERGSLAIESEDLGGFATRRGRDGRQYAQYGIGQPLLAIPFYFVGRALAERFGDRPIGFMLTQAQLTRPREQWQRFGVSLFNQFVAALLVVLLFALAADLTGDRRAAVLTAVLYGAGTMAWVHSKPFFTEQLATLLVFSAFSLLIRARLYRQPRWITLAGCAAGYALLTRLDSVLAFPALGLLLVWPEGLDEHGRARTRPGWRDLGRFAPPVALACLIIGGLNWVHFGGPLESGYEARPEGIAFINPLLVGLYGFLFSLGKGLFFFSPPLLLFFWAIRRFMRISALAGWAAVALIVTVIIVHAKWINWAGGWCWGPRHIFMVHVFLALPISALLMAPRKPTLLAVYGTLLAVGIVVQLYGTSQNFIDYYYMAFRDPRINPNIMAKALYNPGEDSAVMDRYFEVHRKMALVGQPDAMPTRIEPWQMLAPVSDSIWRFQNSPWGKYKVMWAEGFHDYFWLERLGYRSRVHQVMSLLKSDDKSDSSAATPTSPPSGKKP